MFVFRHNFPKLAPLLASTLLSTTLNKRPQLIFGKWEKKICVCCLFLLKYTFVCRISTLIFFSRFDGWTPCLRLRLWLFNGSKIQEIFELVPLIEFYAHHHRYIFNKLHIHICLNKCILSLALFFSVYIAFSSESEHDRCWNAHFKISICFVVLLNFDTHLIQDRAIERAHARTHACKHAPYALSHSHTHKNILSLFCICIHAHN